MHNAPMVIHQKYLVACSFYIREWVAGARYRYTHICLSSLDGLGRLHTMHPPAIGDAIALCAPDQGIDGSFRVVKREWSHVQSLREPWGTTPPVLRIAVVPCEGFFADAAEEDMR